MSEVIDNLLVQLSMDTKEFETSMKDVNRATKQMETSFNTSKKALDLSEKSMEDYARTIQSGESVIKQYKNKLDSLNDAYKEQEKKLSEYKQEFKQLPDKISNSEKKLKELEETLGKNSKEYKDAEKELQKYKQQLSGMDRTLSNIVSGLRSYQNQIQLTENKMKQARKEVDNLKDEMSNLNKVDLSEVSSVFDDIDISNFTGEIEGLNKGLDFLSLGAKGCGLALAGIFVNSVINGAREYNDVISDLEINLGVTKEKAEDLRNKIMIFSDGGYQIESISESVELLAQNMELNEEQVEKLSKAMAIMKDKGYEINDMVRFMEMAYSNFGMSGEDALGLIIRGQQQGLNIAGDFMDTLLEYTPIFSQFGIDAQTSFSLISKAMKDTGMDSDKIADMLKEVFLTITDGSTSSKDALSSVGINVGKLKKDIDSGKLTMVGAFNKVNKAILGVKDETKRAQALQDIYKGTVEYGNQKVLESWLSVKDTTIDTKGAIDEVTTAYESSYKASQQDFSNSWERLKQTIGIGVLPVLTAVIDTTQNIFNGFSIVATNFGTQIKVSANQFKAFTQELGIGILDTLSKIPFAEKMLPNLHNTLQGMKTDHENTIKYIQSKEQEMKNNANIINGEYKADKEKTFNDIKNNADTKTKELSNAIDTNTKDAKNKAKTNIDSMKTDISDSLSGLGNIALTKTGEIPKATKQNLDTSTKAIKQFGTDAYLGVKTSFAKLEQSAKQSMTNLYKGVSTSMYKTKNNVKQDATDMYLGAKNSFSKLEQSAKSSFSSLYNGCTNSMRKLRINVQSEWDNIRNTLSRSIRGNVNIVRTTQFKTEKAIDNNNNNNNNNLPKSIVPINGNVLQGVSYNMDSLKRDNIDYNSSRYTSNQNSNYIDTIGNSKITTVNNDKLYNEIAEQNKILTKMLDVLMSNKTIILENSINLDGKVLAKGTAKHMVSEFASINSKRNRLNGVF